MKLEDIRKEIDGIDDGQHRLFCRRMQCSKQVAAAKQKTGDTVYKPEREKQVLGRYSGEELYGLYLRKVMQLSRYAQYGELQSADAQDTDFRQVYDAFVSAGEAALFCMELSADASSERGLSVQEICSLLGDFGTALADLSVRQDKVKVSFRCPDNCGEQEKTRRLVYMLYKESLHSRFYIEEHL